MAGSTASSKTAALPFFKQNSTKTDTFMPLPKSNATNPWIKILEAEGKKTVFTEHHRSFEQLQELRKLAGLPHGLNSTHRWLASLIADKKIRHDRGTDGVRKNVGKYIFV